MAKTETPDEPMIARDATYYRASDTLRARVHRAVAAEARSQSRPAAVRWFALAASFALVSAISWNAALLTAGGSTEDRLAREVMTAHVRSLMVEGHLNDVVSTDQHTVKPWFIGKLDFAPRVADFAGAGFTLAGGRLDYVNGRAVAALTYRHRLHVVNVFEWPAKEGDSAPRQVSEQGYSMVRWTQGGIAYWAISDAAGADLLALPELFARS